MSVVGIIGDLHLGAVHPMYRRFCADVLLGEWDCTKIVQIGDLIDSHNVSFHPREVKAPSPSEERKEALAMIRQWNNTFPKLTVTLGNHDMRLERLAATVNIVPEDLRDPKDRFRTPKWDYVESIEIDDVRYFHGDGYSGKTPALDAAMDNMMNTVCGHIHHAAGIKWHAARKARYFGMDVGCGVDDKHLFLKYGVRARKKSVLACGVVVDGVPHHIAMPCGPGEKYRRR